MLRLNATYHGKVANLEAKDLFRVFTYSEPGEKASLLCPFPSWVLSEVLGIVSKKDELQIENFLTDSVFLGEKHKL